MQRARCYHRLPDVGRESALSSQEVSNTNVKRPFCLWSSYEQSPLEGWTAHYMTVAALIEHVTNRGSASRSSVSGQHGARGPGYAARAGSRVRA